MEERPGFDELLEVAVRAAREAGNVLAERFGGQLQLARKGAIDLVTDADRAAEEAALRIIKERFPLHAILAEESGAQGDSSYRWIIDPLDGTTNYAHALPQFAVTVACEVEGRVEVGAILDPMRREMYTAIRGQGAFCNGQPLSVSNTEDIQDALLSTGFPYWIHEEPDQALELFGAFLRKAQGVRRYGAAALDLAWLASGRYDGFFELGLKPWDVAAGALLIQEAGGIVTHLDGSHFTMDGGQILAAPPKLHGILLSIAKEVGPVRIPRPPR